MKETRLSDPPSTLCNKQYTTRDNPYVPREMEKDIVKLVEEKGPLTGEEIRESMAGDDLLLWRTCVLSRGLVLRSVATHYLRLDRQVDGFARLSPSILREFLTYSVVALRSDPQALAQRLRKLSSHIRRVSELKLELARRTVSAIASNLRTGWPDKPEPVFIIGGDIVFQMAHDVPRPERSTGKLVNGSDMDIVVILGEGSDKDYAKRLDEAIYSEKYALLRAPHLKEEIDYVVKDLGRVKEQLAFKTFKHMVACKILHEGWLLYGDKKLFDLIKRLLNHHCITEKLEEMEIRARAFRRHAEVYLLEEEIETIKKDRLHLFYPTEESEEFE